MADLYLIFSHELTEQQEREAREVLGVGQIYSMPDELQALWSQIPPQLPELSGYLGPIKDWLGAQIKPGDYILIQGDFGATYLLVKWAFRHNCQPIYATTQRRVEEIRKDEEVITKRVFEHVRFRFYEKE